MNGGDDCGGDNADDDDDGVDAKFKSKKGELLKTNPIFSHDSCNVMHGQ